MKLPHRGLLCFAVSLLIAGLPAMGAAAEMDRCLRACKQDRTVCTRDAREDLRFVRDHCRQLATLRRERPECRWRVTRATINGCRRDAARDAFRDRRRCKRGFRTCRRACRRGEAATTADGLAPGGRCERKLENLIERFVRIRLGMLQRCARDAVADGSVDGSCCLALPSLFNPDACSSEDLAAAGFLMPCGNLTTPACAAITVADPRSFSACLECYLGHSLNCMVATTYAISGPETAQCFVE